MASLGDISAAAILCEQTYRSQVLHLLFYNDCEHQRSGTLGYSAAAVSNKVHWILNQLILLVSRAAFANTVSRAAAVLRRDYIKCLYLAYVYSMLGSRQR